MKVHNSQLRNFTAKPVGWNELDWDWITELVEDCSSAAAYDRQTKRKSFVLNYSQG